MLSLVQYGEGQRNAVEVAKRMIWRFYRALKDYKLAPSRERTQVLRARFDRTFRRKTGYATLDSLLRRLYHNKDELLCVVKRPEIPLNTNVWRTTSAPFTKRKISGGILSNRGRDASDIMLSIAAGDPDRAIRISVDEALPIGRQTVKTPPRSAEVHPLWYKGES